MKKIIALVLALVMVLSLGTVAFAAEVKQPAKVSTVERVGEIAANAAARALQIPAFMLGTSMKFNQNAIVNAANMAGAATYYGTKAAAATLDNAVAVGGGIAQVRINVTGSLITGAINLLHKAVVNVQKEESSNELLQDLDKDLLNARDTVKAGVEVADKTITAVKSAVDNAVDVLFNGTLNEIRHFFKNNKKADDVVLTEESSFKTLESVSNIREALYPAEMTLKEILVPGEWMEYVKYRVNKFFINNERGVKWDRLTTADLDEDESYFAGWVNKFVERAYTELTDSTNFEEMKYTKKAEVSLDLIDGGEVAEFLYRLGYKVFGEGEWNGIAPSLNGKVPAQEAQEFIVGPAQEAAQAELAEMR